jgi:putative NADH-flavin reductase
MTIALFGASGTIGRRIAQEALDRGHTVTAIVRHPDGLDLRHEHLTAVAGDVTDPASVARAVAGHDVVVSAISPSGDQQPQILVQAAHALIEGLPRAGVKRLVRGLRRRPPRRDRDAAFHPPALHRGVLSS